MTKSTKQGPEQRQNPGSAVDLRGSTLARNTILNFLGLAFPYLVGFVTIPFVIRGLGTDRFGILSLVWIIFGYFTLFDLGLGRATTKFAAEALGKGESHKVAGYIWTTAILQLSLAVIAAVFFLLAIPLLTTKILHIPAGFVDEAQKTFFMVAISLPINFAMNAFRGALEAGQRFDLVNLVKVPANVLFYVLPLVGLMMGMKLPGIVLLLVLSRAAALVAWFVLCLKVFPGLRAVPTIEKAYLKPLFSFSIWITLSSIVNSIVSTLDRLMIGAILTVKAVSYYSAPYEVTLRLGILPGSFALMLFPAFSSLSSAEHKQKLDSLYFKATKYLLISAGPLLILMVSYARPFLRLWLGQEFAQNSTLVLQFLALGFLFLSLRTVPFNHLLGIGRAKTVTMLQVIELVFFAGLAWLLISKWGIQGAALASGIRMLVITGLFFWVSFKAEKLHPSRIGERQFVLATIILMGGLAAFFLSQKLGLSYFGLAGITITMLTALYVFSLDAGEKSFALEKLKHYRKLAFFRKQKES